MKITRVALVVSLLAAAVAPLRAHHSFSAEFDHRKPVTLLGTLTKMEWINPHGWVYLDVKDPSGKIVRWAVETGAPNALIRRGLRKNDFPLGVEVKVTGYLAKSGKPVVNGQKITFPDGRDFFFGSSNTGAPGDAGETEP